MNETVAIVNELAQFSWHDYLFFIILLLLSAAIGIYFGFYQKKQNSADEYLLGGKQMGVFEISMSLIASTISGITILAVPTDIYRYGVSYWLCVFAASFALIFSYFCVLPVFLKLQTASTYEYLKRRFNESLRDISSIMFTLSMFLYMPILIYIPALALAQGTGFNVHLITPLVCGVCIFYTTIGGLKAVVWTDALQLVVMIVAVLIVTIVGTIAGGGFSTIWNTALEGERIVFDFDVDPTKRDTVWANIIGTFFLWCGFTAFGQGCVQKCLALPNQYKIKYAYIVFGTGVFLFFSFSAYMALMIYARYHDCDPYMSKKIRAHDQILPLYILEVTENIPGLPGIFIAGIFSASLSSLSAAMNALACTLYADFIERHLPKDITQTKISVILKSIVVVVGVICTALVFIVQHFKSILEVGLTIVSFTAGPSTGLFLLGMFVPIANTKGALFGTIGSMLIMGWIIFTSLYYRTLGYMSFPTKPISVEACVLAPNETFRSLPPAPTWDPPFIYRISHYYYGLIGGLLVIILGIPASYFTRDPKNDRVDKDLLSPIVHWAIPDDNDVPLPEYYSVEKANQLMKEKCDA